MKITFLGTGGGRFVMAKQMRRTAGFLVKTEESLIHVDPGPGALVYFNKLRMRPRRPDAIFVSHAHLDHSHDTAPLIELMTDGGRQERGIILASESVVNGIDGFLPAFGDYHKNMVGKVLVSQPEKTYKVRDLSVTATPTWHDDPSGTGFILDDGETRVAYLSDTGYTEELGDILESAEPEVIIFNLIFDGEQRTSHTNLDTVRSVIQRVKPRLILLQHFGARITMRRMERMLAKKIEEETGITTVALRDGDVISLNEGKEGEKNRRIDEFI
ncbi:MAG: MBL fold metallo-hydrolase [Candidatus Diapherotrites archaeon]|nr:MBL fold metallo-hydrolase [Candidatus Diapherotrites archaeon]